MATTPAALEKELNWSGVAIDAIRNSAPSKDRPHTRFITAFVTDTDSGTSTIFFDPKEAAVSSADPTFTWLFTGDAKPRQVQNRTLDLILTEAGISKTDYISMDIEWESRLRSTASPSIHSARVARVEAHAKTRQQISITSSRNDIGLSGAISGSTRQICTSHHYSRRVSRRSGIGACGYALFASPTRASWPIPFDIPGRKLIWHNWMLSNLRACQHGAHSRPRVGKLTAIGPRRLSRPPRR